MSGCIYEVGIFLSFLYVGGAVCRTALISVGGFFGLGVFFLEKECICLLAGNMFSSFVVKCERIEIFCNKLIKGIRRINHS